MKSFDSVTLDAWREKIIKDLRGADYSSVVSFTEDGIEIEPALNRENSPSRDSAPATAPLYRGSKTKDNDWFIIDSIPFANAKDSNTDILKRLNAGATAILLDSSTKNFDQTMAGVMPEYIEVYLSLKNKSGYQDWREWSGSKQMQGGLGFDPIGERLTASDTFDSSTIDYSDSIQIVRENTNPLLRTFRVNASIVANAGGTLSQQITYALGCGHDYLVAMLDAGIEIDQASAAIEFNFSVGLDFFSEIAKLRCFRTLWAEVISAYEPKHACSINTWILGESASFELSEDDEDTNILRNTSAAMAAAVAGLNAFCVLPHNLDKSSSFGNRIARNIQLLLKEESHLDQVIDPAAGSYLVEYLSDELSKKSWSQFSAIEGSFWNQLVDGEFQSEVHQSFDKKVMHLNESKITRIGVNKFRISDATNQSIETASDKRILAAQHLSNAFNPSK